MSTFIRLTNWMIGLLLVWLLVFISIQTEMDNRKALQTDSKRSHMQSTLHFFTYALLSFCLALQQLPTSFARSVIICIMWLLIICWCFSPGLSFSFPLLWLFYLKFFSFSVSLLGFFGEKGVKRKKLNPSIEQEVDQSGAFFSHFLQCQKTLLYFSFWTIACLKHILKPTSKPLFLF